MSLVFTSFSWHKRQSWWIDNDESRSEYKSFSSLCVSCAQPFIKFTNKINNEPFSNCVLISDFSFNYTFWMSKKNYAIFLLNDIKENNFDASRKKRRRDTAWVITRRDISFFRPYKTGDKNASFARRSELGMMEHVRKIHSQTSHVLCEVAAAKARARSIRSVIPWQWPIHT